MKIAEILHRLREEKPVIHCISNYVTANDCANMLLACGASPIMADAPEEAEEITAAAQGLLLNIGTLHRDSVQAMLLAGKKANRLQHPVVFDPVGVGSSQMRKQTARRLLQTVQFAAIRGNISEIRILNGADEAMRGVDAAAEATGENIGERITLAQELARKTNAVVVISGKVDVVADAMQAYCIYNGHPLMQQITGCGCQLSALTAAFLTADRQHPLEAAAAAVCAMGICGEMAVSRLAPGEGNASCRNRIIDAMLLLTPESLEREARYAMR